MCIRDSDKLDMSNRLDRDEYERRLAAGQRRLAQLRLHLGCLLYTSDAADERSRVDLGGRRIIKKKKENNARMRLQHTDKNCEHR